MSSMLDQLCAIYGIVPHYHDIWGNLHHTSDAAKRALLKAMGLAVNNEEELLDSLHAHHRCIWRRPLQPVQVVREQELPFRIAITLPAGQENQNFSWCLRREFGEEDRGEFVPVELDEAERTQIDGQDYVRRMFVLNCSVELGYHKFSIARIDDSEHTVGMSLIVAPTTCYVPPALQDGGRLWGFAAQLYGIRSRRNWGMGDLSDLYSMFNFCAEKGADTVLLNPLHALFPEAPEHASPYSPSSRAYFNTLYLDVEGVSEFPECAEAKSLVQSPEFQERLRALRATDQVDYQEVARLKRKVLERLYLHFRDKHLECNTEPASCFRAFQAEHGESLRKLALFEALQEHFHGQDESVWGWPVWPEAYRDQHAPEVAGFCATHLERVEFFEYLQWQVFQQMAAAGERSRELELGVGVMLDLAIGVAEGGASTWTRPELHALSASAGAPPDDFNLHGQDWGLPPWIPHKLTEAAYEPFIELLRANMRDAGALRIDHVMGLRRMFWVARGLSAEEGAYVLYPFDDLLGILALESHRNRCLVVGEDLGTVPDEVRQALEPMNVLSTRLFYFERWDDGSMKPPHAYPANALAAVTTHDLPTLLGYWRGLDIELRTRLNLYPSEEMRLRQAHSRTGDRQQMLASLEGEGLLPPGVGSSEEGVPEMTPELAAAIYAYIARTPSRLVLVQMEDALGVAEPPNVPGTTDPVYPCWRLKVPLDLEDWDSSSFLQAIMRALRTERPPLQN